MSLFDFQFFAFSFWFSVFGIQFSHEPMGLFSEMSQWNEPVRFSVFGFQFFVFQFSVFSFLMS